MRYALAPRTVRTRAAVVAAGVVLGALVVSGVGIVWLVRARLIDAERTAALLRARDVLALAESNRLPVELSFPGEENAATQVLDRDGLVVASTGNLDGDHRSGHDDNAGSGAGESPLSSLRPAPGESSSEIRRISTLDDHWRYVVVVATSEESSGWRVISASSLESTDETIATLSRALLIGLPLLVLLVGMTTRLLVSRALRPVADMTREVGDITQNDLSKRVLEPGTGDEIAELAATMNDMLVRLQAYSERQRRFIADASHELRSPLASARAILEVAQLHPGTRAELLDAISDALVDHGRLDHLTLDLLELARLEDGAPAVSMSVVDVDTLLRNLVQRRPEGAIEIRGSVGAKPADPMVITRVLTNVMDNAARHRRSRTVVRVTSDAQVLELSVEDDGPGVPPGDRKRILEPFTRLDEARSAGQGTGLGLAIVQGLVRSAGGSVSVSTSEMDGAAVVIRLPTKTG